MRLVIFRGSVGTATLLIVVRPVVHTQPTPAGPVPVTLTPQVSNRAGARGSAKESFAASVSDKADFTASLDYCEGRFGSAADSGSYFNFDEPVYTKA